MHAHVRYTSAPHENRSDWRNLRAVYPFVRDYTGRVAFALLCLALAKVGNVGVPLVLKGIVDGLDASKQAVIALPIVLLTAYGALRLGTGLFNELRDTLFARVRYHAMRRLATQLLDHLYRLSLRFHLERKTGAISRDLERGTASVSALLNYLTFSIAPTLFEFALVALILLTNYDLKFTFITFGAVAVYVAFTLWMAQWRMHYRHSMNALDSEANNQAVDGLINYETVKYFGNARHEVQRYDDTLRQWEEMAVKSQTSMSALNFGQGAIIALGVTAIMFYAANGVVVGTMTLGDLVLVNALMLQLFLPLGFLGVVYRQTIHALADMDMMFRLLGRESDIRDTDGARALKIADGRVAFRAVSFHYQAERPILHDVSFEIPAGRKVAVVGPSGAGKSTLVRLLFRFFEPGAGAILIDDQDIRDVTQDSLRAAIGIVPQDTVLFNNTVRFNIAYARPDASQAEIEHAARMAHIHDFIASLPAGYDTVVGERGLKLSGGEKQRVAIARVVLKNPPILVFDEATSALDTQSERAILAALREVSVRRTTLVIAHRLSTIVDADEILVLEQGRIVERGTHDQLLRRAASYAHMWSLQQKQRDSAPQTAAEPNFDGNHAPV
jgi:ATP-binding cassette subfamily B protein